MQKCHKDGRRLKWGSVLAASSGVPLGRPSPLFSVLWAPSALSPLQGGHWRNNCSLKEMAADCNGCLLFQEALLPSFPPSQSSALQSLVVPHGEVFLIFSVVCGLENSFLHIFLSLYSQYKIEVPMARARPHSSCVCTHCPEQASLRKPLVCGFVWFLWPNFLSFFSFNKNKFPIIKIIHSWRNQKACNASTGTDQQNHVLP